MKSEVIKIDKNDIDLYKLRYAAGIIKSGGLVAFPTETVYGLGADALNEEAVKSIFTAKGRPSDNPLIVHIADKSDVKRLVRGITSDAALLMDRFWPGPLTLVMDRSDEVPGIITAGLGTVAVRMPAHPVALALIKLSGLPVAAPSANISGKPSPTTAKHVIEDLSGRVDVIIDAGSCEVGLESTVLDITVQPPVILRPGGVTPAQLGQVIKDVGIDPALMQKVTGDVKPKSPGMKYTHYSPKADVVVVEGKPENIVRKISQLIEEYGSHGVKVGVLATDQTKDTYPPVEIISAGDRRNPETIAANFFRSLREFDERGVQLILAEAVENTGIGLAIMSRMNKAAGFNIIKSEG